LENSNLLDYKIFVYYLQCIFISPSLVDTQFVTVHGASSCPAPPNKKYRAFAWCGKRRKFI